MVSNTLPDSQRKKPIGLGRRAGICYREKVRRISILYTFFVFFFSSSVSATEYILSHTTMGQVDNGISYSGGDPLILTIEDNVTIRTNTSAGIQSTAPVTIRSPASRTLTIIVDNDDEKLYGIRAPSVFVESGVLDITVTGENDSEKGNAFGICAESGNVTISGGSVFTEVETTGHKNKGIYASRYIHISDGLVSTSQQNGMNTFGLDGGDVETGDAEGGVLISGGCITVQSTGGKTRNFGIDSKFGTVRISGNPVVFILEDESGSRQNFPYNTNITAISGGNAVVFTSTGGNYSLRENAVLTRNAALIPGRTFEIPAGRILTVSQGSSLVKPADTTLLSGEGYGRFEYTQSVHGKDGAVIYTAADQTRQAPVSLAGLAAGLGIAVWLRRRDRSL